MDPKYLNRSMMTGVRMNNTLMIICLLVVMGITACTRSSEVIASDIREFRKSDSRVPTTYERYMDNVRHADSLIQINGNTDNAQKVFDSLIVSDSVNAKYYYFELGLLYFDKGDYSSAITNLDKAIEKGNNGPHPLLIRSYSHLNEGNCELAKKDIERLNTMNDKYSKDYERVLEICSE